MDTQKEDVTVGYLMSDGQVVARCTAVRSVGGRDPYEALDMTAFIRLHAG